MRLDVSKNLMFFLVLLMLLQPVQAQAQDKVVDNTTVCMDATQKMEKQYQIKKHLLTTISSVETGRWNEKLKQNTAWPWTINAQGKGRFFATKEEAVKEVKRLQASGVKSIDVGCMQINLAYHGKEFKSIEEAFEPEKNVEYAAKFLTSLYESRGNDWIKAAMAYHSSVPTKALIYKKKIVSAYEVVKRAQTAKENLQVADVKAVKAATTNTVKQTPVLRTASLDSGKTAKIATKTFKRSGRNTINANQWREAKLAEWRRSKTLTH